jgi:hypothetical protein
VNPKAKPHMKNKKPFFAKLLESQMSERQARQLSGGGITNRFPGENLITVKHPTDYEDVTDKTPSDNEDE